MPRRRRARNSHGNFQETGIEGGKSQETRHPARPFPKVPGLRRGRARHRACAESARLSPLRLSLCAFSQGEDRQSRRSGNFCGNGCRFEIPGHVAFSRHGHLQRSPQKLPGAHRLDRRRDQWLRNDRRLQSRARSNGFRISRRDHGLGCWRKNHANHRIRHRPACSRRHRVRVRRRAHVRRNVELDANGKDERRGRATCRATASLHFRSHQPDHRRRHGQFRFVRRCHYCRTEEHDRLCRPPGYQRNHASGFAKGISDRGISSGTRLDRHHRAPQKNARTDQPAAQLFFFRAVNYSEALAWLYSLQRLRIKLGLEHILRLIAELHADLSRPRVIHVAGTNGKGSVCAMLDSICRAQGYCTALFTSPHLITFRERIRVNGKKISEEAAANGLTSIRNLTSDWDPQPTFFEIATALALKYFAENEIDPLRAKGSRLDQSAGSHSSFDPSSWGSGEIVVLETGMGGRLDATNAVQSNVSVITSIDLDHEKWLRNLLEKIAAEKAGNLQTKVPAVSAPQKKEVEVVLRNRAADCESPIEFITEPHEQHPIALCGVYQKQNAALAIAAIHAAKIDIDARAMAQGLATVDWPARFQKWDERTIIDGAHNPAAARILAETWYEHFGDQ